MDASKAPMYAYTKLWQPAGKQILAQDWINGQTSSSVHQNTITEQGSREVYKVNQNSIYTKNLVYDQSLSLATKQGKNP